MTPRTAAGRALLDSYPGLGGMEHEGVPIVEAIEAEASALDVERLRLALETPEVQKWLKTIDSGTRLHIAMLIAEADARLTEADHD